MLTWHHDRDKRPTRSLVLVLLAWMFIGGQAFLAAGSIYNLRATDKQTKKASLPWQLLGQSAGKMRSVAVQAGPETITSVAVFLAVANALGLVALTCALLSWSRSKHASGRLTIAAAMTVILVNSILNLPYA